MEDKGLQCNIQNVKQKRRLGRARARKTRTRAVHMLTHRLLGAVICYICGYFRRINAPTLSFARLHILQITCVQIEKVLYGYFLKFKKKIQHTS